MNSYPTLKQPYHAELLRLIRGQPTALNFRARNKTVLLTPGILYGFAETTLVVAGIGEKCGIIDLREINITPFIKAGLSAHAATVLKTELERTYANATQTIEHETRAGAQAGGSPSQKAEQSDDRGGRSRTNRNRTAKDPGKGRAAKGGP